jgi:NTE family protein
VDGGERGHVRSVKTAVVLAAGGIVGQAFHLGVLGSLAETVGFDARDADVLVGSSAGSLVAAGLAGGLSVADLRAELLGEPLSPEGRRVRGHRRVMPAMPAAEAVPSGRWPLAAGALLHAARRPWAVRPSALASSLLPPGQVGTEMIARSLQHLHGVDWPARDLRITAVRARDAQRVVFGQAGAPRTDVGTAVAASCAIPSYFAPVVVDGEAYVDGGAHSPSNADVVVADRPDLVLVLSPMSVGREGVRRPRADLLVRLAVRHYLGQEVRRLRRAGAEVVVLQPGPDDLPVMGLNPMRGIVAEEVMDRAAASTRARLAAAPELAQRLSATRPGR